MNSGVISSRYANAFLRLTQESGRGEQVCEQVRTLLRDPESMPEKMEPDLEKLILLLRRNGREDHLKFILRSFVDRYYDSVNARLAHLTTAVPSPGLGEKLCGLVAENSGLRVVLETSVDPDIIGGFVFEIDDYILDASVRSSIEKIRRELIEKNNRIV
ncbi:MAG: F0F1 ATP synthase subunit delta [Bacteroidales bacterium]|nr:F0F1 ATP synthase subunit delta [Bacteroidales bacterium]